MKKSESPGRPGINRTLAVRAIPTQGLVMALTATPAECAALARRFHVPRVLGLTASVRIVPGDRIRIDGDLTADMRRECVVSLEPFDQTLRASFSVFYAEQNADAPDESDFDIMNDEPVEAIQNGRIDLGALIAEQFGLHLDPFPRKPGAVLTYQNTDNTTDDDTHHPFADLKKRLKKK